MNTDFDGINCWICEKILFWMISHTSYLKIDIFINFINLCCNELCPIWFSAFLQSHCTDWAREVVENRAEEKQSTMPPFCLSSTASEPSPASRPLHLLPLSLECPVPSSAWAPLIPILRVSARTSSSEKPLLSSPMHGDPPSHHLHCCAVILSVTCGPVNCLFPSLKWKLLEVRHIPILFTTTSPAPSPVPSTWQAPNQYLKKEWIHGMTHHFYLQNTLTTHRLKYRYKTISKPSHPRLNECKRQLVATFQVHWLFLSNSCGVRTVTQ